VTGATVSADGETITVHIRLTFRKRGGRKLVVTPDGAEWAPRPRIDNAMVKALARAFRWRKMLDEGVYAKLEDLARAKGLAPSYVSGILRLTLLAPEVVEAILDGRQPATLQLDDLLGEFPLGLGIASAHSPSRLIDRVGAARASVEEWAAAPQVIRRNGRGERVSPIQGAWYALPPFRE
jgi:hypothetical protein